MAEILEFKKEVSKLSEIKSSVALGWIYLQSLILDFFQFLVYKNGQIKPDKILIFRIGSLGDGICALPSINAIRVHFPDAKIDILTKTAYQNLVSIDQLLPESFFNKVINFTSSNPMGLIKRLRQEKYDLVIELPPSRTTFMNQVRNLLFFKCCNISSGFGWTVSRTNLFLKSQEESLVFKNEVHRLLSILSKKSITGNSNDFNLKITSTDIQVVNLFLDKYNLAEKSFFVMAVGGKLPLQRWPIDSFKYVCSYFKKKYPIVVLGGIEDTALANELSLNVDNVINACGFFTPMQSAFCISKALLMLSNDTGPFHLSYAMNTFTIGIFTARDVVGAWNPPAPNIALRKGEIECSMCWGKNDDCSDNVCIKRITPQEVVEVINSSLPNLLNIDASSK